MVRSFLASLPPQQQRLNDESMIPKPNLDTFVFVRVRANIGAFSVDEGYVSSVSALLFHLLLITHGSAGVWKWWRCKRATFS